MFKKRVIAYPGRVCKVATGTAPTAPAAGFESGPAFPSDIAARLHFCTFSQKYQRLHAADAEEAALLLRELGYTARYNGAQGMHWQRAHAHVWLAPDGELWPLGATRAAALAGWAVLSEHTEVAR